MSIDFRTKRKWPRQDVLMCSTAFNFPAVQGRKTDEDRFVLISLMGRFETGSNETTKQPYKTFGGLLQIKCLFHQTFFLASFAPREI